MYAASWCYVDSTIEAEMQADTDALRKRICVIGAGPTGLGALKVIADAPQYKEGFWDVVAYEAREALGGVWCAFSCILYDASLAYRT